MAYQQNPGRGPMMKTGRNIPKSMCSPATQRTSQINDIAANVATVHNSGGNVNAYTSPGWKRKVKSKKHIGKKTIGQTQGAAYDANEINNAALMNYKDGLMRSRDSVSTKQVTDHLKKFGKFNSNEYLKSGETYDKRNDSYDSSPAQQRRDAISGKLVPKDAVFSRSTYSFSDDGSMTKSTPYSTKGTPGTANQMPNAEWKKLVAERKAEGKGPINPPGSKGSVTKGKPGISGTVSRTIKTGKPAGIKPVSSVTVPEKLMPTKITPTRGSKVFEPIHGQSGMKRIDKGIKKVPGFFNRSSGKSSGLKGCFTS
jgi:hypothetical protein